MALVESHHLVAHILEGHGMLAAYLWTGLLGGGGVVFKGGCSVHSMTWTSSDKLTALRMDILGSTTPSTDSSQNTVTEDVCIIQVL